MIDLMSWSIYLKKKDEHFYNSVHNILEFLVNSIPHK